jgi:molecular chaperone DnaK (HSP70)
MISAVRPNQPVRQVIASFDDYADAERDSHLGGDDFDRRLVDYLADEFKRENNIDLRSDPQLCGGRSRPPRWPRSSCRRWRRPLVNLPFITAAANGPNHLTMTIMRSKFEDLTADLVERCVGPVKQAMDDAKVTANDIDEVILVGGSTRILAVQSLVRRLTGGKDPNMSVNPDKVVALGAAVQAGVLKGEVSDVLLLDVTPLSLGVETRGGVMTKIIERNTTIPARRNEVFTTAEDNQPAVDAVVVQGEREMASDNRVLGRFKLGNIRPAPRREPHIEVTFDIDANGILNVTHATRTPTPSRASRSANSPTSTRARWSGWLRRPRRTAAKTRNCGARSRPATNSILSQHRSTQTTTGGGVRSVSHVKHVAGQKGCNPGSRWRGTGRARASVRGGAPGRWADRTVVFA